MIEEQNIWKEKLGADLESSKSDLKHLRVEAEKQKAETKKEILQQVEVLEQKREDLEKNYQKIKAASGDAAQDLKEGMSRALDEFQKSVQEATNRFKNQSSD